MRATREDSGWNTDDPVPTSAAASSSMGKLRCHRQQDQAAQGETHAQRQRIRHRPAVGEHAHQRLQQRRGELVGQRDQSDLAEIEREIVLEDRIDGEDQRLDHVVEQMRKTDGAKDAEIGAIPRRGRGLSRCNG
jgi:hypothetical protein